MVIWSRRRPERPRPSSVTWPYTFYGSRCDLLAYFNNLNNPSWNLPLSARRLTPGSKPDWIPHESPPNHFGYGGGHCSAPSCVLGSDHQPFILKDLNSWLLRDTLGPIINIPVLTGPRPVGATFCMCCIRTCRCVPLGSQLLCEYPRHRPNQVKCSRCSGNRHACVMARVLPLFLWQGLLMPWEWNTQFVKRTQARTCIKRLLKNPIIWSK